MSDCFDVHMDAEALGGLSSLGLAHIGDAVYELLVRSWLVESGRATAKSLHRETVRLVCAGAQARRLAHIAPLLTEEERDVCRRARNAHTHMIPTNATHEEYHAATALEALFGFLYLQGRRARLQALFSDMMERFDEDAT